MAYNELSASAIEQHVFEQPEVPARVHKIALRREPVARRWVALVGGNSGIPASDNHALQEPRSG